MQNVPYVNLTCNQKSQFTVNYISPYGGCHRWSCPR